MSGLASAEWRVAGQANNDLAEAAVAASKWLKLTNMRWFHNMAPVVISTMFVVAVAAWVSSRMQRRAQPGAGAGGAEDSEDQRDQ